MDGFEHVVDRRMFESLDGVLVVGGHEYEHRQRCRVRPVFSERPGGLQPGHTGHADVQKHDIGAQRDRSFDSRRAMPHVRDDAQTRPQTSKLGLEVGGEQRLVFGNQGGGVHGMRQEDVKGNRIVASVPPSLSSAGLNRSVARAPYSACSRSRTCTSPNREAAVSWAGSVSLSTACAW